MSDYFITDRLGAVHRTGAYCASADWAQVRVPVNDKQIQVYGLTRCSNCFPTAIEFKRLVSMGEMAA